MAGSLSSQLHACGLVGRARGCSPTDRAPWSTQSPSPSACMFSGTRDGSVREISDSEMARERESTYLRATSPELNDLFSALIAGAFRGVFPCVGDGEEA